jgi:hypothetical protein
MGVMRRGLVGIDRCGEADPILGGIADRFVVELSEVAEHLDELEADRVGRDEKLVEVAIELRLSSDELKLATAEVVGLAHEALVGLRR